MNLPVKKPDLLSSQIKQMTSWEKRKARVLMKHRFCYLLGLGSLQHSSFDLNLARNVCTLVSCERAVQKSLRDEKNNEMMQRFYKQLDACGLGSPSTREMFDVPSPPFRVRTLEEILERELLTDLQVLFEGGAYAVKKTELLDGYEEAEPYEAALGRLIEQGWVSIDTDGCLTVPSQEVAVCN